LYYTIPFRKGVLNSKPYPKVDNGNDDPLYYLKPLFTEINNHKKRVSFCSVNSFIKFV